MKENQPVLGGNMFGDWDIDKPRKRKKGSKPRLGILDFKVDKMPSIMDQPDVFNPIKKEPERDPRRNFSQTQKNEIWDRQRGRCAGSHCEQSTLLRSATHYDHIIPWEIGGRTIVSNGQALCTTCHSLKTHKDRLKKIDKKRKPRNQYELGIMGRGGIY
ncbi:MAG: HNH endonuclease [Candidatus Micrarchaeia archaeon]